MKRALLILLGAGWLVAAALAATNDEQRIVTVKLKSGTQVAGVVVREDDQQISVLVEMAGGSISETRTIAKTDIQAIEPVSETEKVRRAMVRAYNNAHRYQLQSAASYPEGYYYQVISNVFQPFLAQYPDSPYAVEVLAQLRRWQAECARVADGNVKYESRWMTATEATRLYEEKHGKQALEQARALLKQGRYLKVIELVRPLSSPEARELETAAYKQWLGALQQEQRRLLADLAPAEQRLASAQQDVARWQAAPVPTLGAPARDGKLGGGESPVAALNRSRADLTIASNQVAQLRAQLDAVARGLTDVNSRLRVADVKTAAAAAAAAAAKPAPAPPTESPDVLTRTGGFFQEHWVYFAVAGLVAVWGISRYFMR